MNEQAIRNALDDLETCSEIIEAENPYESGMIIECIEEIEGETGVER